MKKELTAEQNALLERVINSTDGNEVYKTCVNLMKECNISNGVIALTAMGIGDHTEYYKVLINRIKNNLDKVDDAWIKKEVIDIFHEIDRNMDDEEE